MFFQAEQSPKITAVFTQSGPGWKSHILIENVIHLVICSACNNSIIDRELQSCLSINLRPDSHIFGPETAVSEDAPHFHLWGNYIYPYWYWNTKITMIRVPHSKLQIWSIYGLPVVFTGFKIILMVFPIKLTPNDPNKRKKW